LDLLPSPFQRNMVSGRIVGVHPRANGIDQFLYGFRILALDRPHRFVNRLCFLDQCDFGLVNQPPNAQLMIHHDKNDENTDQERVDGDQQLPRQRKSLPATGGPQKFHCFAPALILVSEKTLTLVGCRDRSDSSVIWGHWRKRIPKIRLL
jgi:hypothetical protein